MGIEPVGAISPSALFYLTYQYFGVLFEQIPCSNVQEKSHKMTSVGGLNHVKVSLTLLGPT